MNLVLAAAAIGMAILSAIALYASSPHCMWLALRRRPRAARRIGITLALFSLVAWTVVSGFAVGLCAMLACWMPSLVVQPYLALLFGTPGADITATEKA